MLYKREIDDNALIQFIILFTLSNADRPVRYDDLINLIFDNCNVNYAEFQIALHHLVEIGHIGKTFDNSKCDVFYILDAGKEANQYFEGSIPVYIKGPIKKYIKPYFKEDEAQQKIKAEINNIRSDEYSAKLGIYDDDDLPLLEVNFYAGNREEAQKIAKNFKSDPEGVYKKILHILLKLPYEPDGESDTDIL